MSLTSALADRVLFHQHHLGSPRSAGDGGGNPLTANENLGLAGLGSVWAGASAAGATLGCDPKGSTNPQPSDLASLVPHHHVRGEKVAVFLLLSGLSRSQ